MATLRKKKEVSAEAKFDERFKWQSIIPSEKMVKGCSSYFLETFRLVLFLIGNGCALQLFTEWILLAQYWAKSTQKAEKEACQINFVLTSAASRSSKWFYFDKYYKLSFYFTEKLKKENQNRPNQTTQPIKGTRINRTLTTTTLLYDQNNAARSSYIYQQGDFHPSLIYFCMSLLVTGVGYKNKTKHDAFLSKNHTKYTCIMFHSKTIPDKWLFAQNYLTNKLCFIVKNPATGYIQRYALKNQTKYNNHSWG